VTLVWELVLAELPAQSKSPPRLDIVAENEAPLPQRPGGRVPLTVRFTYLELQAILSVYGRQVAAGTWRDYALDFLKDRALFSIYRHHSERPLYLVEKNPRLRERQGQFMVMAQDGRILKRGHDLAAVLRVLEPKLSLVRG
jgi:Protein of unknown function (DUF2794)